MAFAQRYGLPSRAQVELLGQLNSARNVTYTELDSTLTPTEEPDDDTAPRHVPPPNDGGRYTRIARIGQGATSEVWKVRDHQLKRTMAMKVLFRRHQQRFLSRFLAEAQVTAQLQHPSIVPVHEIGALPDGSAYFTMELVEGRTLADVTASVHAASQDVWATSAGGWTLRRLIEVFRRVCEAVAYAHDRGVVHRDLKPENIMVGQFGQVKVMDWGIARVLGEAYEDTDEVDPVESTRSDDALQTRVGTIAGTPAYMSPEQAAGDVHLIDRRSDVFSLGGLLYFLLSHRAPFQGSVVHVLYNLVYGEADPLVGRPDGPMLPGPLVDIVKRAMRKEPDERYRDAGAMGADVADWLDGAERAALALTAVGSAAVARREARSLRREARRLTARATAHLERLPDVAGDSARAQAWGQLADARRLEDDATYAEWVMQRELTAAFAHEPGLPEAHMALARETQRLHADAEARGQRRWAGQLERQLLHHLQALSPEWPGRRRLARYLEGTGSLALDLPDGIEAVVSPLVLDGRRLVRGTPMPVDPRDATLCMGSYLVDLVHGDGVSTVPVQVRRGGRWEATVRAPPAVPDGAVWVPAGRFLQGAGRVERWVGDLLAARHPVTCAAWAEWLAHVASTEGEQAAAARVPTAGVSWDGLVPPERALDEPVVGITRAAAEDYAAYRAAVDGRPWRLPTHDEWEKLARGVDGRSFPCGPHLEPHWARLRREGSVPEPSSVHDHPSDVSVYGIAGLAGNVADWTATDWGPGQAVVCGGSFLDGPQAARCDGWRVLPDGAWPHVGVRLVASLT